MIDGMDLDERENQKKENKISAYGIEKAYSDGVRRPK